MKGDWSDWMRRGQILEDLDIPHQNLHMAIKRGRGATTAGGYEVERKQDAGRAGWYRYRYRYVGEERGKRKLTEEDVCAIRAAHLDGAKQVDLARRYGVHASAISYHVRKGTS